MSGCHSNVTLDALSHDNDGYGVMLIIHTRDAQATTVSIFILHTLTLFAECRMSPETAAGKPKSKACSAKFCSVFNNTFHEAVWHLLNHRSLTQI